MKQQKFYALIIGTEILNQRRVDKHFNFLSSLLADYGEKLSGSFMIEDDPELIIKTITFIASQANSIVFSFGGIGSTPDDHTRLAAAKALDDGKLYQHQDAVAIIKNALGNRLSKHSLKMAQLPKEAHLIENPINQMPAFYLQQRFFFLPGFPEMSHAMIKEILPTLISEKKRVYRYSLTALCKESELIEVMEQMPREVEFSSLPKLYEGNWRVVISVAAYNELLAKQAFMLYTNYLDKHYIKYSLKDMES